MDETMRFNENVKFGTMLPSDCIPDQKEIRHIPQFYRASADYAYRLGGPVVRKFIDLLPLDTRFKYVSIDSRIHMLMPGWMPCIGGWHCDDFYRPQATPNVAAFSPVQPDLQGIVRDDKYSKHHALVIGDMAPTEFITTPFNMEIPIIKPHQNLYAVMDKWIEDRMPDISDASYFPILGSTFIKPGQIVSFDCFDFHRGTVAQSSGWRMFMRATESNHWEPQDEIRTQTQVYLESFHAGW
jgi:hypothetical protein